MLFCKQAEFCELSHELARMNEEPVERWNN